jgi:hypothetical protein
MQKAGYKPNDGSCIRLKGNERVKARLAELPAQAAKKSDVTVQSLLDELEAARARADSLSIIQHLSGLSVQRVEVRNPDGFSECETTEQVISRLRFSG